MIALHLKLPPDMLRVVDDLARRRDVTAGQIVRQMIADGLRYEAQRAKAPVRADELGYSYARLVQRFRAGFPGHAHTWVADRILTQKGGPEGPPHEDPVLIEGD